MKSHHHPQPIHAAAEWRPRPHRSNQRDDDDDEDDDDDYADFDDDHSGVRAAPATSALPVAHTAAAAAASHGSRPPPASLQPQRPPHSSVAGPSIHASTGSRLGISLASSDDAHLSDLSSGSDEENEEGGRLGVPSAARCRRRPLGLTRAGSLSSLYSTLDRGKPTLNARTPSTETSANSIPVTESAGSAVGFVADVTVGGYIATAPRHSPATSSHHLPLSHEPLKDTSSPVPKAVSTCAVLGPKPAPPTRRKSLVLLDDLLRQVKQFEEMEMESATEPEEILHDLPEAPQKTCYGGLVVNATVKTRLARATSAISTVVSSSATFLPTEPELSPTASVADSEYSLSVASGSAAPSVRTIVVLPNPSDAPGLTVSPLDHPFMSSKPPSFDAGRALSPVEKPPAGDPFMKETPSKQTGLSRRFTVTRGKSQAFKAERANNVAPSVNPSKGQLPIDHDTLPSNASPVNDKNENPVENVNRSPNSRPGGLTRRGSLFSFGTKSRFAPRARAPSAPIEPGAEARSRPSSPFSPSNLETLTQRETVGISRRTSLGYMFKFMARR